MDNYDVILGLAAEQDVPVWVATTHREISHKLNVPIYWPSGLYLYALKVVPEHWPGHELTALFEPATGCRRDSVRLRSSGFP
ncbi:hypothetical protein EH223_03510 [candidate division KSB1 bacterium]|nr:hypothetical protein [candidate division KSB1 bacterium]RQW05890.1 MAG: hypothetical protein EH223_03510 [candidate division KSB1 bacterium]